MPQQETNTVKLTLDLTNPPVLTEEQKARLAALAELPDDQIDTSDAPSLPETTAWVHASPRDQSAK